MELKPEHREGEEAEEELTEDAGKQHFHVLAVDDSLVDRILLERLLRVSSYHVTCVDSGDKALQYLGLVDDKVDDEDNSEATRTYASSPSPNEGTRVNLIMTDYCMPGMNGYDLLKRVKGSNWKDVPVVIMSSENVPSRINMCMEGGAHDFLLKPVQLSDLERIQPFLIKSCKDLTESENDDKRTITSKDEHNNKSSCINNVSKRKATSPAEASDRRPKIKELAVV